MHIYVFLNYLLFMENMISLYHLIFNLYLIIERIVFYFT